MHLLSSSPFISILSAFLLASAAVRAQDGNPHGLPTPDFAVHTTNVKLILRLEAQAKASAEARRRGLKKRFIASTVINGNSAQSLFVYHGNITVGTPEKQYPVLFDTGSYALWLRSTACTSSYCTGLYSYDSTASLSYSSSHTVAPSVTYVDGTTISGVYATEVVGIANLTVQDLTFVEVTSTNYRDTVQSGLMGMSITPPGAPATLMDRLMATRAVSAPVVGYFVDNTDKQGRIDFGGVDTARYSGNLTWLPVLGFGSSDAAPYIFFQTYQDSLAIVPPTGYTKQPLTLNANFITVFDTGSSMTMLPMTMATQMATYLNLSEISSGSTSDPNSMKMWGMFCPGGLPTTTLYPRFTFSFNKGAQILTLDPADYFWLDQDDYGRQICITSWAGLNVNQSSGTYPEAPGAILGNTFLRKYYSVFDYSNPPRVGFGLAMRASDVTPKYTVVATGSGAAGAASGTTSGSGSWYTWGPGGAIAGWNVQVFKLLLCGWGLVGTTWWLSGL